MTSVLLLHPCISCTCGHYCSSQDSQQNKSINDFFFPTACRVPFSTMKSSQQGKIFLVHDFSMSNVSSSIGSFRFALPFKYTASLQWLQALCSPSEKTAGQSSHSQRFLEKQGAETGYEEGKVGGEGEASQTEVLKGS